MSAPTRERHPATRPPTRVLVAAAAMGILLVLSVVVLVSHSRTRHTAASSTPPPTRTTSSAAPTRPRPTPSPTGVTTAQRTAARSTINRLIASVPDGQAFAAAVNMRTGASISTGATNGNWTASSYKLVLVEVMLLQHQQQGATLSSGEDANATRAIENSDNAAGYQLWLDVGRNAGMQAAFPTLGLDHAQANGTDPTFTKLTAPDAIALARNLVDPKSPLNAASRSYLLGLMAGVESDQRWGVGAASDPNSQFYNKNGWLSIDDGNAPGETDDGLWVVSSIGVVKVGGDQVLMAAFTEHMPDMATGVRTVEALAKAMRTVVAR